jgi:protein SCO1
MKADFMSPQFSRRSLFGLLLSAAMVTQVSAQAPSKASEPPATIASGADFYHGGLVSPPLPKPKFTLTDTSGASFDFRAKTEGFVTLLFFGYAHCPDICPLQMHMIADALRKLPPASAAQFKVVFVTTDFAHDTPVALRTYLDRFNKGFIGLTGTEEALQAAQVAANLPPAKKGAVQPDGQYEIGHSAFVLAYTKDNLAHLIYPAGMKTEDWVHDLPFLVSETWTSPSGMTKSP